MARKKKLARGKGKKTLTATALINAQRKGAVGTLRRTGGLSQTVLGVNAPIMVQNISSAVAQATIRSVFDSSLGAGIEIVGTHRISPIVGLATKLGVLNTPAGFANGSNILGMFIGPSADIAYGLPTDIATLGIPYIWYRFKSLRFRYLTSCPSTTAGKLFFAYYPDVRLLVSDEFTDFSGLSTAVVSRMTYSMSVPVTGNGAFDVKVVPRMHTAYYADGPALVCGIANSGLINSVGSPEASHLYQGLLLGLMDSAASTTYGDLFMDYSIELFCKGSANLSSTS